MNRETLKVFEYMVNNDKWLEKIKQKRRSYPNYKDFLKQSMEVIDELLATEKKFYDYPRNEVNIKQIVDMYF